jgi:branched-chain amino acid transport system substrate-binding protein
MGSRSAGYRSFLRRIRAGLLVGMLLALAGACGGNSNGSSATAGKSASGTATGGGPATGSPIKVGVLADLTGNSALSGSDQRIATDLAAQVINDAGGVNGHRLELTYADTRTDPAQAVTLATQLVQQDHVDVLIGAITSAECLGVSQLVPKLGIVYVTQSGCANEELTAKSCNKYTFRMLPVGRQQDEPLAQYLVKTFGKRWAMLYPDYAFGQSQLAAYSEGLEKFGGAIQTKIPIPLGEANVTPYVTKVPTDGSVDGVIASFSGADQARVIGGLQQFGVNKKLPIVGTGTKEFFAGVYPDAVDGSLGVGVHLSEFTPDNKFDQAFFDGFRAQAAKEPSLAAALGGPTKAVPGGLGYQAYTGLTALKVGMVAAKFTGKADTEKLISALEGLNIPQGTDFPAGPMIMNKADHQARATVYIYKVNGQQENVLTTIPPDQVPQIGDCHV